MQVSSVEDSQVFGKIPDFKVHHLSGWHYFPQHKCAKSNAEIEEIVVFHLKQKLVPFQYLERF